ncbi:hypothetical protein Tco_0148195 [Tanacetum coccineum]
MKADSKNLVSTMELINLREQSVIFRRSSSRNPTGGYEGIRRFKDYHGDGNMDGSLAAKEKGRVEHFGITAQGGRGRQAQTNAYIILPMKIETSR